MDRKPGSSRETAIRKSGQRNRRRRRAIKIRIFLILFITLLGTGIALSFTVLFPVKSISVSGKSKYTNEQIINASHVKIDENLLALKTVDISKDVAKSLPYIGSVKVQRIFPDKVKLTVESTAAAVSYFYNDSYYIADKHSKLLEKAAQPADGSVKILGLKITGGTVGETMTFENNTTKQIADQLYDGLKNQKISINSLDVSDDLSIKAAVNNGITVKFGSYSDLQYKIIHLKTMLGNMDEKFKGIINLELYTKTNPQAYTDADEASSG